MVTGSATLTTSTSVLSDAVLVERIAALGDRAALAELDARHGMTLYAIAYTLLLNPDAADVAVATTLREAWRRAGSFNAREQTVGRWLADLTRKVAQAGVNLDLVYVATRNRIVFGAPDLDALRAALGQA